MPGRVAVPYYTFPGVSAFSLLPGRVYTKVDNFQIIPTALSQVLRERPHWRFHSWGRLSMAACITSLESQSAHWRDMCPKCLRRRSRTKVLTGCKPVLLRIAMLVTLPNAHPPDEHYYTLAPHIKAVKVMQLCLTGDAGLSSLQQD